MRPCTNPLYPAKRNHPTARYRTPRLPARWHHDAVTHARQHPIQVVAHRGASDDAPEHTLAAYRKAIEDGADALECDVRLTADGHLVCVHDRRVNRTSNGRGAVSALELADLAALDFGSWKNREESPDWESGPGDREDTSVLTLERLLELVADAGRRVQLAIETKHPTRWAGQVEERLLHLLKRFGLDAPPDAAAASPVRVMSFSARSLHRIQAASPDPADGLSDAVRLAPAARRTAARGCPDRRARDADRAQSPGLHRAAASAPATGARLDGERTRGRRALRSASASTQSSRTGPARFCPNSAADVALHIRPLSPGYRECTGAFAPYSIVTSASLARAIGRFPVQSRGASTPWRGAKEVSGVALVVAQEVPTSSSMAVPHGPAGVGRGKTPDARAVAQRRGVGIGRRRCRTDPFRTAQQRLPARQAAGRRAGRGRRRPRRLARRHDRAG